MNRDTPIRRAGEPAGPSAATTSMTSGLKSSGAGSLIAASAATSSTTITVANVSGSVVRTSYSTVDITRVNSSAPLGAAWTIDGSALWYGQDNDDGTTLRRISPTLRLSYRWRSNVSFEAEVGAEDGNSQSATTKEATRRQFFSLGYRWDF